MRHDEAASQRNARAFVARDQRRGQGLDLHAGRSVFGTVGTEPGYGTSDGGGAGSGTVGGLPKMVLGHPVLGAFPADHSAVWEL